MEYLKEDGLGNRSSREGFLKSQKTLGWVVALKFWVPLKIGKSEADLCQARCFISGSVRPAV
jgi:hypothetical protein